RPATDARRAWAGRLLTGDAARGDANLRREPGRASSDLRGDWAGRRAGPRPDRLHPPTGVPLRAVRADDCAQRRGVRDAEDPERPPLDPAAVPSDPVIGVRQGAADRLAVGVPGQPQPPAARTANHG